jgi:enoyl-CoA hydratase/carnithine racemase
VTRPEWSTIAVTRRSGVTELRLHTDDGPLVWSAQAHRDVTEAFHWLQFDAETKVVVIRGTGGNWCSSIDVASFAGVAWAELWWESRRMLVGLMDLDVPVIAAVAGEAFVHAELGVLGDIVLATPDASFADRAHFATRGTVPGDGAHIAWASLIGPSRSRYFLITGATIAAEEARSLGFVHEIHEAGTLYERAWELAEELASHDLPVLRYTKAALSIPLRRDFSDALSHGLALQGGGHWAKGGIKPPPATAVGATIEPEATAADRHVASRANGKERT